MSTMQGERTTRVVLPQETLRNRFDAIVALQGVNCQRTVRLIFDLTDFQSDVLYGLILRRPYTFLSFIAFQWRLSELQFRPIQVTEDASSEEIRIAGTEQDLGEEYTEFRSLFAVHLRFYQMEDDANLARLMRGPPPGLEDGFNRLTPEMWYDREALLADTATDQEAGLDVRQLYRLALPRESFQTTLPLLQPEQTIDPDGTRDRVGIPTGFSLFVSIYLHLVEAADPGTFARITTRRVSATAFLYYMMTVFRFGEQITDNEFTSNQPAPPPGEAPAYAMARQDIATVLYRDHFQQERRGDPNDEQASAEDTRTLHSFYEVIRDLTPPGVTDPAYTDVHQLETMISWWNESGLYEQASGVNEIDVELMEALDVLLQDMAIVVERGYMLVPDPDYIDVDWHLAMRIERARIAAEFEAANPVPPATMGSGALLTSPGEEDPNAPVCQICDYPFEGPPTHEAAMTLECCGQIIGEVCYARWTAERCPFCRFPPTPPSSASSSPPSSAPPSPHSLSLTEEYDLSEAPEAGDGPSPVPSWTATASSSAISDTVPPDPAADWFADEFVPVCVMQLIGKSRARGRGMPWLGLTFQAADAPRREPNLDEIVEFNDEIDGVMDWLTMEVRILFLQRVIELRA